MHSLEPALRGQIPIVWGWPLNVGLTVLLHVDNQQPHTAKNTAMIVNEPFVISGMQGEYGL